MIKTEFNHETGVLDSKYIGDIDLQQVVDYIRATKNNDSYPRTLKILTDATKANFIMQPEDLPVIVEENYQSIERYNYIIDAIVLASPKETALSLLFQHLSETNKYKFQVFSTREAACKWLERINPEK
jgi:hypothetical protein